MGVSGLLKRVFGSENERLLKPMWRRVEKINALEDEIAALSDEALAGRTAEFKERLKQGETLDSLLEEAFATVREAAKRALGQRHYDVQLVGGMVLHSGKIAEMKTGEGKTLVATLAVYLNALEGKGVHVVTVNDYLAKRDSEWMGRVYQRLGLTTGCVVHGLDERERKQAYAADVTYGTNNEFGFDYLRDNMKGSLEEMVQREHNFAIVDEVDSILIDEARTPLIISGPTQDKSELYITLDSFIPQLSEEDYEIDEKARSVTFTEEGNEHIEQLLREAGLLENDNLYDAANVSVVHHANQALKAHKLFQRDKDYIVRNNKVVIIDEFTGRMMEGRRYSEGLHQALEAKEKVQIQPENQTLASVTFQNYFRLYAKLAGMTGTAMTEQAEFQDIYKLDVLEIPTNKPIARIDEDDELYRTAEEKYEAIVEQIADCAARGQPVLVGTVSIEKSEHLSAMLKDKAFLRKLAKTIESRTEEFKEGKHDEEIAEIRRRADNVKKLSAKGIKHNVLNARYHEQEAQIVAEAGVPGAVTIATNMAGRGTDIQLGGSIDMRLMEEIGEEDDEETIAKKRTAIEADIAEKKAKALDAGGLYVLATERHESRRIDNQLRGRSGRQGDPGVSKFFLSLEDDLMRIFAPERMNSILQTLGIKRGEAIIHPWMTKAVERAQKKVEQRNFEIRKNLLKYDDVINDQRKAIFEQRKEFMSAERVDDIISDMRTQYVEDAVATYIPAKSYPEQWDIDGLKEELREVFGAEIPVDEWAKEEGVGDAEVRERLIKEADRLAAEKTASFGAENMRQVEKMILLWRIDTNWREHLQMLDHLRSAVGLRSYAQRDPLNEFKTEAFALFEDLLNSLRKDVTQALMRVQLQRPAPPPSAFAASPQDRPPLTGAPQDGVDGLPQIPTADEILARSRESHVDPTTGENEMARGGGQRQAPPRGATVQGRQAAASVDPNDPATWGRVSRNAPCPCGSGKKYKHCHGAITAPA